MQKGKSLMNTQAENTKLINNANKNYTGFTFKYTKNKRVFAIITCIIVVVGIVSFIVRGFNWDIDFVGGTIMQYNLGKDLDVADQQKIEDIVRDVTGQSGPTIQIMEKQQISIKTLELTTAERDDVFKAVAAEYNITEDDIYRVEFIAPTVGAELRRSTIIAVLIAVALMLVYITIRFDFLSGISGVLCLTHDMFVMLTFYSLLQIPMNTAVIAALLTILGYSINATIIIFDRVRENIRLKKNSMEFGEIVNLSINQTLLRSINTTITTLLTILMIYILGVTSIRNFVFPLIIGITAGLYSSVCLAGSLWDTFKKASEKSKANKSVAD